MIEYFKWYFKTTKPSEIFVISSLAWVIVCVIVAVFFGVKVGFLAFLSWLGVCAFASIVTILYFYTEEKIKEFRRQKDKEATEIISRLSKG